MLLIDRILAAAHHQQRRGTLDDGERELAGYLATIPVYDVTNVLPLFRDWDDTLDKPIPKRAPHPMTWAEWVSETEFGMMRSGHLLAESTVSEAKIFRDRPGDFRMRKGRQPLSWLDDAKEDSFVYTMTAWFLLEKAATTELAVSFPAHEPCLMDTTGMFGFCKSGEYIGHSYVHFPSHTGFFGLPIQGTENQDIDEFQKGWFAPFMTFALLHCKNVVTTTHGYTEQERKRVRKSGNPPRVTYKTIQLEVPATVTKHDPSDPNPEAKGTTRFHLCRGHFKNLTHPRYKNPGLHWWPAHWKGNIEQGAVISDRAVVPANNGIGTTP
jgi:hypothetical protein